MFFLRYVENNPSTFKSEDACHALTCAIMLLNTDHHGQVSTSTVIPSTVIFWDRRGAIRDASMSSQVRELLSNMTLSGSRPASRFTPIGPILPRKTVFTRLSFLTYSGLSLPLYGVERDSGGESGSRVRQYIRFCALALFSPQVVANRGTFLFPFSFPPKHSFTPPEP